MNKKWLIGCGIAAGIGLLLLVANIMNEPAASSEDEPDVVEEKKEQAEAESLEYKQLPIDVDQFVTNYEAVAMISDGDPLPLPDKLEITEDDKANFITLYDNFDDFDPSQEIEKGYYPTPPTIFKLGLNKEDNTLRSISYIGPLEVYTFVTVVKALDISDDPEIEALLNGYLASPASYENEIQLDGITLEFKSTSGTLTYGFTGE